jgi:hypothetical protein
MAHVAKIRGQHRVTLLLRISIFEIDLGVSVFCNLIGRSFSHHVGFKKGQEAGLTLEGEVVAL